MFIANLQLTVSRKFNVLKRYSIPIIKTEWLRASLLTLSLLISVFKSFFRVEQVEDRTLILVKVRCDDY